MSRNRKLLVTTELLLLAAIFSCINYLVFLFNPENVDDVLPYILLVFVELYVMTQTLGAWWTMLYAKNDPRTFEYYNLYNELKESGGAQESIDVFITTYGEDIDIIRETATAARDMYIEHKTYILDDGRSEQVKQLAEELGIEYLTRENNKGKKAGNLNNALTKTNGEFFAIFDADHRPARNFLLETLPFFGDAKVAFVQTPQVLRNQDNFIAKGSAESQSIFYDLICAGKNAFNSAFWVGTNAVFRREAILDAGGVVEHSSEDLLTSYEIHKRGWKSIYIPKILSVGYAPNNLGAYLKQQLRWAGGGLNMFFRDNPIFTNLNLDQKLQYWITSTYYLNGLVILIILCLPLLFMLTGQKPLDAEIGIWALHYFPYFLFQFGIGIKILGKFSISSAILTLNSFPAYLRALIFELRGVEPVWRVSGVAGSTQDKISLLLPYVTLAFFNILVLILGLINVNETGTTLMNGIWIIINTSIIVLFIVGAFYQDRSELERRDINLFINDSGIAEYEI